MYRDRECVVYHLFLTDGVDIILSRANLGKNLDKRSKNIYNSDVD